MSKLRLFSNEIPPACQYCKYGFITRDGRSVLCEKKGVTSPFTLYDEQTASFGVDKDYDQSDATGFINLFGLSIKERAKLSKNWPEVK